VRYRIDTQIMKVSSRQILLLSSTIIAILSATICTTTAFIPSYNTRSSSLAIIKPSTLKETILQQESGERSSSYQEGRGRGRGDGYGRGRGRGGPGGRGGRGTIFALIYIETERKCAQCALKSHFSILDVSHQLYYIQI